MRAACAFSSSRFTKAATRSSQLRRERVLGRPKRIMQAGPRIPVGARPQRAGAGPTCWADTAPHSLERRRGLPGRLGRREAPPLDAVLACRAWSTLAEHLLDDVPARWNPQGWPSMRASFGRPLIGISSQTAGPACGILGPVDFRLALAIRAAKHALRRPRTILSTASSRALVLLRSWAPPEAVLRFDSYFHRNS